MCDGRAESAERDRYLGGAFLRDSQASGIVNWDFSFPEKQFQNPCRPEKKGGAGSSGACSPLGTVYGSFGKCGGIFWIPLPTALAKKIQQLPNHIVFHLVFDKFLRKAYLGKTECYDIEDLRGGFGRDRRFDHPSGDQYRAGCQFHVGRAS